MLKRIENIAKINGYHGVRLKAVDVQINMCYNINV